MAEARVLMFLVTLVFLSWLNSSPVTAETEVVEHVLTLDHSNFSEIVSKHDFIVVEFYAPWCGHCKALAPEYEKAASILSSHEPSIVLAKVDANEQENRELANKYEIQGFPTIKILRNGGERVQEYNGPREADGIVNYLKKLTGPASSEIKSMEDSKSIIDEKKIFIVGLFPKFSGEEFDNFLTLADNLRSDYDFGHAHEAKFLSRGEEVDKPTLRLLKPFDEPFVDFQVFQVEAMEKFIAEASVPLVTLWNNDPNNQPFLSKFFENSDSKAMLFVNFSKELDDFHGKYKDVASQYKGKGISFLLGDIEASQGAFQYFGLKEEQAPLMFIQKSEGEKYLRTKIEPDQIESWMNDYSNGKLKPFLKSEPIPVVNDEPVKVVVASTLKEIVFDSRKNVLIEFYAPWCGHCKKLAPILDEVAISYEKDTDVVIAKMDATANDITSKAFEVQGFPTLYFRSSSGTILPYNGNRTKEDIINFIQSNRDKDAESVESVAAKDEL